MKLIVRGFILWHDSTACSRKFDAHSWRDFSSTTRTRYRVSQTRSSHQPVYLVVSYQWQHLDHPRTIRRACCLLVTTRWRCMCAARRTRLGERCMGYNIRMKLGLGFITLISGEGKSHRRWRFNRRSARLCYVFSLSFCSSVGYMLAHLLSPVTTGIYRCRTPPITTVQIFQLLTGSESGQARYWHTEIEAVISPFCYATHFALVEISAVSKLVTYIRLSMNLIYTSPFPLFQCGQIDPQKSAAIYSHPRANDTPNM